MKASTLRPGLLVSLKTTVRGGVAYKKVDLEQPHLDASGSQIARWETTREISDPQEFEAAIKARGAARSAITAVCCASSFGLLCPSAEEAKLESAIAEARRIVDRFNGSASCSRIDVYALVGRVAQDDAEAARAIGSEVRELLEAMQAGIKAASPEAIREAANKARALGSMLSPEVSGQVSAAIVEARQAARAIVARVERAGETAATVVAELATRRLEEARFAFLDLDEAEDTGLLPDAPAGRGIDLEAAPAMAAGPSESRALEF